MGLFTSVNTWRAPLQLIDCWLPEPPRARSAPARQAASLPLSPALKRFSRAGWLGRAAAHAVRAEAPPSLGRHARACTLPPRHDGRVALAGRMDEVCAALDRLAASEEAAASRHRA